MNGATPKTRAGTWTGIEKISKPSTASLNKPQQDSSTVLTMLSYTQSYKSTLLLNLHLQTLGWWGWISDSSDEVISPKAWGQSTASAQNAWNWAVAELAGDITKFSNKRVSIMDISEVAEMMQKRFAGKTILKGYKHCISSLGRLRWPRRYNSIIN